MKDERTQYGAVDKSQLVQQIYDSASISFAVRKNWAHSPTLVAGRKNKIWWISKILKNSLQVKLI